MISASTTLNTKSLQPTAATKPLGSAKGSLKVAEFWLLPIHAPKPKTATILGICMFTMNTLTMWFVRNTRRCIILPQTVMATANTKAALICVQTAQQKRCVHKMPSAKNRYKAYLAALCGDGWGCTTHTFVQGYLQAKTTKNWACVCRCKRKARYALYAVQRLGSGCQLGEA